jgi:hypothetical protein
MARKKHAYAVNDRARGDPSRSVIDVRSGARANRPTWLGAGRGNSHRDKYQPHPTSVIGSFTCKHVQIIGIVEANESEIAAVGMDGPNDTASECHRTTPTTTEALEVNPTFENLHLTTGGPSTMSFTYAVTFPGLGV